MNKGVHFLSQHEEESGYTLSFKCKLFGVSEPCLEKRKKKKSKEKDLDTFQTHI